MSRKTLLEVIKSATLHQADTILALVDIAGRAELESPKTADEIYNLIEDLMKVHAPLSLLIQASEDTKKESQRNAERRSVPVGMARLKQSIEERRSDKEIKRPEVRWKDDLANRLGLSAYRHLKPKLDELGITEAWISAELRRK